MQSMPNLQPNPPAPAAVAGAGVNQLGAVSALGSMGKNTVF